jgi:gliding motility-associated-like protein
VTAQNGSIRNYILTITRGLPDDDDLSSIELKDPYATLTGPSSGGVYTASVDSKTASIKVLPVSSDPLATITVNGAAVKSGNVSDPVVLSVGMNTIVVKITAQDNVTSKSFVINVSRAPSSVSSLSALQLSDGSLSPAFQAATMDYNVSVAGTTAAIKVTATATDATASISINDKNVASGSASDPMALKIGENEMDVMVTAQDGKTTSLYKITISRKSADADLSSIELIKPYAALTATTGPGDKNYRATVKSSATSITEIAAANEAGAVIKINGKEVKSGHLSPPIKLSIGENKINTVVTAPDGVTEQTYIIMVNRAGGQINLPFAAVDVASPAQGVLIANDGITVHQGVSPNGDGVNDFLVIDGISAYPDNKLTIIDRNGAPVFEAKGYDNSTKIFNGHSSKTGKLQAPGTYFYTLEYTTGGVVQHKTGYIVLKY